MIGYVDSKSFDVLRMTFYDCDLSPQNLQFLTMRKNITQTQTEGYSIKYLTNTQNCQVHQKEGKPEELS